MRDVAEKESVAGLPAVPVRQWHRQTLALEKMTSKKPQMKSDARPQACFSNLPLGCSFQ